MNEVLVSIICTNYNKGDWIIEAIESFLCQKVDFEYEILLIDDASTDHSPKIIQKYAKKYPNKIRAFYNKKNLGITKTWIKICKEVKGKYIARCDGDDYWIDDNKLQKQVELLIKNKNSQWCSTDYNEVTLEGETINISAFESGLVNRPKSYAEMLTTKGFTMASTWLIDATLMKKINMEVDPSTVDDTFNIQLDLFNKTKPIYLPEATTAYRNNEGSDSHPTVMNKIQYRQKRLLQTQLEYIEKYKDVDYDKMLKILLKQSTKNEIGAIERLKLVRQLDEQIRRKDQQILDIINSKRYRTGSLLLGPVLVLKKALKKLDL